MIRPNPDEIGLPLHNDQLAQRLDEIADLLDAQDANPYRAAAYRNAARTVRGLEAPISQILNEAGTAGLTALPGIGKSLARTLARLATTGRLPLLSQLRGMLNSEQKLATVPGIGPNTAIRIHEALGIDSLADLEAAAYDGRLEQVQGIGRKRLRAVRESLAGRFRTPQRLQKKKRPPRLPFDAPPIGELLSVDEEYRRKADADRLLRVAPRRFNPNGQAWLPILHTQREDRHYTALYSNTARAHELGTLRDWVVIFRDAAGGGQWTVLTSRFGPLQGRRIIRGFETQCEEFYAKKRCQEPFLGSDCDFQDQPTKKGS